MELLIFQLIVLIFSVVIHEVSHGYVAEHLGDPTARLAGRLTLNPLKHLDLFGSVLLPLLLVFTKAPLLIGWAKPVPFNPNNLRNPQKAAALIAAAGPLSNILIAVIFAILASFLPLSPFAKERIAVAAISGHSEIVGESLVVTLFFLSAIVVFINILLAVFNLVPIPPLDGSKVLFAVLPNSAYRLRLFLEQYGLFLLLIFIFWGLRLIYPIVIGIYLFLT